MEEGFAQEKNHKHFRLSLSHPVHAGKIFVLGEMMSMNYRNELRRLFASVAQLYIMQLYLTSNNHSLGILLPLLQ